MDLTMAAKSKKHTAGQTLHDLFRELFALHGVLSKLVDTVHTQAGMNTSKLKIINTLLQFGSATVPDIAAHLDVSRQFVQTVCNDLLDQEYLLFSENPRHKRSKLITLTDAGRLAYSKAQDNEYRLIERLLPDIDSQRAGRACEILKQIRKAIKN
ncbi:MAG: MarR family transcriptional regulator [Desulfobacteraceae bacterium]|jgi:DNA-binding MarR family transcriptional regulator